MGSLKLKITHEEDYRKLRRDSYPKVTDQLDAIYHLTLALEDAGLNLPKETLDWLDEIDKVKTKFKKPA